MEKIIKHRYIIVLILFTLCLVFKIHSSSIGFYDRIIGGKIDENKTTEIIGISRGIRSDEWMVHTPYYFSQKYNNYKKYSKQMSYSGQNMILGYNAPVKDITLIGKPFTWGYILLGNERGLSWYWCSKLFLLFLVSFELVKILTKNKKLSLAGAFIITYSPPVQWWFVPHITDVFFWGMTLIVLTYHFFTKEKKLLYTILMPCSLVGYALALFPSCQIPVAIISLILVITMLIRDREKIVFRKKDILKIFLILFVFLTVIGYFVITSIEDLKLIMNTVYPGSRISTGGDESFRDLFTDLTTLFLPYKQITYLNNSEASTFIHLAPILMIVFLNIRRNISKKELIVGKSLYIILICEILFMIVGMSEPLAKITLFSYINRMHIIYGFTGLIFTIWMIYVLYKYEIDITKIKCFIIALIYGIVYLLTINKEQLKFLPMPVYLIEITYICVMLYLILRRKIKPSICMFVLLIIISSLPINPIAHGAAGITNHRVYNEIRKISDKDDGYWLALNDPIYAGYVLASGARVINATNFYPDYEKWKLIDKKGKNIEFYNRYANMSVVLTKNKTKFSLKSPDHIKIELNYQDLKKLKIKYIFALEDLENDFKDENIENKLIYSDGQINIYKLQGV